MLSAPSMKLRRHGVLFFFVLLLVPFTTVIFFTGPDLSQEQILQHKIVELRERLHHAEMLNQERRSDVINLRQKFNILLNSALADNGSAWMGRGALSKETKMMLGNLTGSLDLQLPSIYHFLPHLLGNPAALQPAFKLSKGRSGVTLVMGVPTVKREVQSYLMTTLQNLIENMNAAEKAEAVIVVFIAETDLEYVKLQASELEKQFEEHVNSGLLEVISPSSSYYPNFDNLRQTLGDPMDRVKWRTKQNLDFAFLMMYCQAKATFYIQLEDDILTKPGYITTMKKFALQKTSDKNNWIILDFCQLGFIGKMLKCIDLPILIQFFVMFYNDKPVDWLLDHMIQTKMCNLDQDPGKCSSQLNC
uniref:MGAT4 conserved region domain-containing protein n=1 Tax=Strigamia maritima TaxID=126957 RepID=T1J3G6_STRMM